VSGRSDGGVRGRGIDPDCRRVAESTCPQWCLIDTATRTGLGPPWVHPGTARPGILLWTSVALNAIEISHSNITYSWTFSTNIKAHYFEKKVGYVLKQFAKLIAKKALYKN